MLKLNELLFVGKNELKKGSELLNLAFKDDPHFHEILIHEKYPSQMTGLFHFILKSGLRESGILVKDSPQMNGIALLIPSGINKKTFFNFPFTAFIQLSLRYKFTTVKKLSAMHECIRKIHEKIISRPHYYLSVIGVNPKAQGQGIGKKMLTSITEAMNREQKPIYLETQNEKNVVIYQKYGFEVIHKEIVKPFLKDEIYFMLRQPSS